jgi:hypothetical protein
MISACEHFSSDSNVVVSPDVALLKLEIVTVVWVSLCSTVMAAAGLQASP